MQTITIKVDTPWSSIKERTIDMQDSEAIVRVQQLVQKVFADAIAENEKALSRTAPKPSVAAKG